MTNNRNLGHTDLMKRNDARGPRIRLSPNFCDRMSPFFEIKFQLSCPVSSNPAPRSLMSQGSPSWIVKVASTTSPVLEDTAWSTAARSISQHRTSKTAIYMSAISPSLGESTSGIKSAQIMIIVFDVFAVSTLRKFQGTSRCIVKLQSSGEKLG